MSRRPVGSIRWIVPNEKARIEVSGGFHPVTGKRWRPSKVVHGNERQVEAALARLLLKAGQTPEAEVTIRQYLIDMWLPRCEQRVAEGTLRQRTVDGYRSKAETHVVPVLGSVRLTALSAYQLETWLGGVTGSERTRLHCYRVISAALNTAVRWQLIPYSPLRAIAPPDPDLPDLNVLNQTEANTYLDAFAGHAIEPLVVLALGAGLRRSEIAGLTWAEIDFEAGTVSIQRGHHDRKGEVLVENPKSKTSRREVSVAAWALDVLRPLRGLGPIVAEDGLPIRPWRISALYKRHVASCGLRWVQFKNLRHSHACLMIENGVDIYTVSRRLGHSTVAVTEKHYVRPSKDADRAAADAFSRMRRDAPSAKVRQVGDRP